MKLFLGPLVCASLLAVVSGCAVRTPAASEVKDRQGQRIVASHVGDFEGTQVEVDDGRPIPGAPPCTLKIEKNDLGDFEVTFGYVLNGEAQSKTVEGKKFDSNGELPFILASLGFLGQQKFYLVFRDRSLEKLSQFKAAGFNGAFAECGNLVKLR